MSSTRRLDYIFTFITQFLVLLAGVFVYKFAANLINENDFSEYALSRRTVSFIIPLLIVGLGVGIPRYVAFSNENRGKQDSYFIAGIIITLCISLPLLFAFNIFKDAFSYLLFGDSTFNHLIPSLSLMVMGMILHALNYGFLRGKISMYFANSIQIINLAIIPIAVFLFFNTVDEILLYTGITWLVSSAIITLIIAVKLNFEFSHLKESIKSLLVYGVWRVPGDFLLAGFLALPAFFTAHLVDDNLKTAGYVAFAMSLLNMAGAAFGPICLILLPEASIIIKNKDYAALKQQFVKISIWTLGLTVVGILFVELFANQIISIYLGDEFEDIVLCVRITVVSSLGYTIYISLRSILDAYYVKAINTKNIIISFVLFISIIASLYLLGYKNYLLILYSFNLSMFLLGFLTFYETKKITTKQLD